MLTRTTSQHRLTPPANRLALTAWAPGVRVRDEAKGARERAQNQQAAQRMRRMRKRRKDKPLDPVRIYPLPLRDSEAHALAADLMVKPDDRSVSDQEWRDLIGEVAATAVRRTIRKK